MSLRDLVSRAMIILIASVFVLGILPLLHLLSVVLINGFQVFLRDPIGVLIKEPPLPGSKELGGVGPYILGTIILVSIASLVSIPISIAAASYSVESMNRRISSLTTLIVRIMIEFPTIVIGLSIYGAILLTQNILNNLISLLGWSGYVSIPKFSALSGAMALAIVMIPYVYTQVEDGFRQIPHHIREAVYSLGFSRVRSVIILSGYIRSAILSGVLIGVAKILGETASLIFTAFGSDYYVTGFPDMLVNPVGSLTLWIYKAALSPYDNWRDLAWFASMILVIFTLALFSLSKYVSARR